MQEYQEIMQKVEIYLQKATNLGGFAYLTPQETQELKELSTLAEAYEDSLPIMPIK
jgi:HTH-type transcriptional regulator / antitoxin HigA